MRSRSWKSKGILPGSGSVTRMADWAILSMSSMRNLCFLMSRTLFCHLNGENPRQVNPRQVNPVLGKPEQEKPAQLNIQESITEKSITDISNIHQSIYPASGGTPDGNAEMDRDRIDRIDTYRRLSKKILNLRLLSQRYGYERVDELVELSAADGPLAAAIYPHCRG